MGSRYTKSIPEFIYFTDCGNGWYSGPFVKNPCKGKNANNAIICRVERLTKLVSGDNNNELQLSDIIADFSELKKLTDWLVSDEGREKLKKAQEKSEEAVKNIDSMRDISPELLRTPFGPVNGGTWYDAINAEKCKCSRKTNVEQRLDGKKYCGKCGRQY